MLYVKIVSLCDERVPAKYPMKQGPTVAQVVWLLSYERSGLDSQQGINFSPPDRLGDRPAS
jgi:hypothetical protein